MAVSHASQRRVLYLHAKSKDQLNGVLTVELPDGSRAKRCP